jgi:hypothetical protein
LGQGVSFGAFPGALRKPGAQSRACVDCVESVGEGLAAGPEGAAVGAVNAACAQYSAASTWFSCLRRLMPIVRTWTKLILHLLLNTHLQPRNIPLLNRCLDSSLTAACGARALPNLQNSAAFAALPGANNGYHTMLIAPHQHTWQTPRTGLSVFKSSKTSVPMVPAATGPLFPDVSWEPPTSLIQLSPSCTGSSAASAPNFP